MRKLSLGIFAAAAVAISLGVSLLRGGDYRPLVAVQVDEFSVFRQTQGALAGKVRFVVTNIGTIEHEFVVIRTNKPASQPAQGQGGERTGAIGELDGVKAGNARELVLTSVRGHYALICNLPGSLQDRAVRRFLCPLGIDGLGCANRARQPIRRKKGLGTCPPASRRRHHVAVHVQRHRRPRVTGALRQLTRRDAGLMPDRDPAMTEIVRVVVRDAGGLAGAEHRLVRGSPP